MQALLFERFGGPEVLNFRELPDPSVPAGTVVQVVQDGYTIGERVLRPALVGVSKGGPKAAPTGANDEAAQRVDQS